jgi:hypothetical protein
MGALRAMAPKRRERAIQFFGAIALHKLMPRRSIDYVRTSQTIQLGAPEFLDRLRGRRKVFLAGWNLRDWELLDKHQDAVRRFLAPAERFLRPARELIEGLRRKYERVVGLLIRQSDYRYWANGEFFFTSGQYQAFIEQLHERFGPKTAIVIATDEVQTKEDFEPLDVTWCTGAEAGPGHYLESFAALSMCDIVVSPPSTFSAWAAFLGNVPILPIGKADDDLRKVELLRRHLLDARSHWAFGRSVN